MLPVKIHFGSPQSVLNGLVSVKRSAVFSHCSIRTSAISSLQEEADDPQLWLDAEELLSLPHGMELALLIEFEMGLRSE